MITLFRVYFRASNVKKYESIFTKHTGPKTLEEIQTFFSQTCSMNGNPTIEQAMLMQGFTIIFESVKA